MNGTPAISPFPRLTRWSLILGVCLLSVAVIGATEAGPANLTTKIAQLNQAVLPQAKAAAGTELMHDVVAPSDATLASATLPGLGLHKKILWMEVTAYCGCKKCCGPHAHGLTASGRSIGYNGGQFVAADTRLFKFGTKLQIPGYAGGQPVEVIDRGGAIKGYHLDVFFPTHQQALDWGRRWIPVTIDE